MPDTISPATYTTAEVAALLGLTVVTFRRRREELHRQGMPRPLLRRSIMRWPKEPIDQWLANPRPNAAEATLRDVQRARTAIHAEYVQRRPKG